MLCRQRGAGPLWPGAAVVGRLAVRRRPRAAGRRADEDRDDTVPRPFRARRWPTRGRRAKASSRPGAPSPHVARTHL